VELLYRAREALYSIIEFETLSQSPPPTSLPVARHVFFSSREKKRGAHWTKPLPYRDSGFVPFIAPLW
jgi:hypothetical protein